MTIGGRLAQAGWAALGALLTGGGVFALLPYIRSEAVGVIWPPGPVQLTLAAALVISGLAASRRAGPFQYATFLLMALQLVLFVLLTRAAMDVGGVTGIANPT